MIQTHAFSGGGRGSNFKSAELWHTRKFQFNNKSVELTAQNIKAYDAVLVSTDHSEYNWNFIVENANLVVDTRNATVNVKNNREKIFKA